MTGFGINERNLVRFFFFFFSYHSCVTYIVGDHYGEIVEKARCSNFGNFDRGRDQRKVVRKLLLRNRVKRFVIENNSRLKFDQLVQLCKFIYVR